MTSKKTKSPQHKYLEIGGFFQHFWPSVVLDLHIVLVPGKKTRDIKTFWFDAPWSSSAGVRQSKLGCRELR